MATKTFQEIFPIRKPVIGMIHLAGRNRKERVERALEELQLYEECEVDGAIIENYHGTADDIEETLRQVSDKGLKTVLGVNRLGDSYAAFCLADKYKAKFIQIDSVQTADIAVQSYREAREEFPNIVVLGGVSFKYTSHTGNPLQLDIREGRSRCEAIVTTGDGTGLETPLAKLQRFKQLLPDFPLIVGAGVTLENVSEQLKYADGAIIGSYFKPNKDTLLPISRAKVSALMEKVKEIRKITP
jgi:predicted TIM-barrel enzyme